MNRPVRSLIVAVLPCLLLVLLLAGPSAAQNCVGESFSNNRLYSLCSSLPELGATLHWTYHPSNATLDVAYRLPSPASGWAAWAINPSGAGMLGANAFLAFQNSSTGAVSVITTVLATSTGYSPAITDEALSFAVHDRSAEFAAGAYTIYATLDLPGNGTAQNTAWQAGTAFSSAGLPSAHPTIGGNILSATRLDFLSGQAVGLSNSRLHRKNIHGVLNAMSWGLLFPLGVIMARYLRVFKSADPAWFYLHITCQCSGYILGVAGWGLGLKLGSESKGITYYAHRNIGIALFCLATLQVFALLLRPNKDNKYRIYWNVYHHSVGYTVILLSIINIFKGFNILNPADKWKNAYIAVISTLGGIALCLEVITWVIVLRRRSSRSSEKSHHGAANGYGSRQHHAVV
ncbi:Cytochrome b561 and DOMON domain-containing protein [Ananas comosus]|uniref:Cytochrome b561 and DOMON domain-containing protein n=1 Tax=Ananas comosus TaxID=4615 RepID=A0A199VXI9_ANACO|nr:Cytochrome b561 and DOMON domain-containing protein [Ananas comosus]